MCSECYQTPCNPRCPNAPEPKAVYRCKYCETDIVEGDEYVEVDDDYYHYDCLEDVAVGLLFDKLGLLIEVAGDD